MSQKLTIDLPAFRANLHGLIVMAPEPPEHPSTYVRVTDLLRPGIIVYVRGFDRDMDEVWHLARVRFLVEEDRAAVVHMHRDGSTKTVSICDLRIVLEQRN